MQKKVHYHFIGMGGIGMSALANILLDQKHQVSGSDLTENYSVKHLCKRGAHFSLGHHANNITPGTTVVYSSGIQKENPELEAAKKLHCTLLHRSELLAELMQGFTTLAIAGTHGKTTTTSLLIHLLVQAGKEPAFAVGGIVNGENGKAGKGLFVAEADESDGTFLRYTPFGAIITNMEEEHMEHYKSFSALENAFSQFISQVGSEQHLFYCGDDPALAKIAQSRGYSYGFSPQCDVVITSFSQKGWRIFYDFTFQGKSYKKVEVALLGEINALNSVAVFALALQLGIEEEKIRQGLATFTGVKRRLEKKGDYSKILFLDDYAHHPTEVRKTLLALKDSHLEKRLVVLFQPHRFTRTRDHLTEFAKAFESADRLFITDIYSAGEAPIAGISAEKLVEKVREVSTVPVSYLSREDITTLSTFLRPHDLLVTMGAGDVTYFSTPILEAVEKQGIQKFQVGLIFGGKSPEHEISLRSARYVYESLDKAIYEVKLFGIDREGKWVLAEEAKKCLLEDTQVLSSQALPLLSPQIVEELASCDIFFPILHGPNGEDGTIQGFFEMLGKPYAGPDFRSCAITMDKIVTKQLVAQAGVPTSSFVSLSFYEWQKSKKELLVKMKNLPLPVYVKPSRCGSSIGISPVHSWEELEKAIDKAFRYDEIILVEEGTVEGRELEFAVIGNSHLRVDVPSPGEKIAQGHFVDYSLKYSTQPVKTTIEPLLEPEVLRQGQTFARRAYEGLSITGISRVDCLLDPQGKFNFFEINAIPGLTKLSLFPKIWAREGITPTELIDRCILLGLTRRRAQDRHQSVY